MMGNLFSSTRRALTKIGTSASGIAKPTSQASQRDRFLEQNGAHQPFANEGKAQDVMQGSKDPRLVSNLYRLGQIHSGATHNAQSLSAAEPYRNLQASEIMVASSQVSLNRLHSSALSKLFDERKTVTSRFELDRLAERHNMDGEVLERLARYVNTPSVLEEAVQKSTTEDNQQIRKVLALWESPKYAR